MELNNSINNDSGFIDRLPDITPDEAFEFAKNAASEKAALRLDQTNSPPNANQVQQEVQENGDFLRGDATDKINEKFGSKFSSIKGKLPFGGSPKKLGAFLLDGLARGILASKVLDVTSKLAKKGEVFFDEEGGARRQAERAAARSQRETPEAELVRDMSDMSLPPIVGPPPPRVSVFEGFQGRVLPGPPGAGTQAPVARHRQPPPAPPPRPAAFPSTASVQPPARPARYDRPLPPIPVAAQAQSNVPQQVPTQEDIQLPNPQEVVAQVPTDEVGREIQEDAMLVQQPPRSELDKIRQRIQADPEKQAELNFISENFKTRFKDPDADNDENDFWNAAS